MWNGRNCLEDSNTHDIIASGKMIHSNAEYTDIYRQGENKC